MLSHVKFIRYELLAYDVFSKCLVIPFIIGIDFKVATVIDDQTLTYPLLFANLSVVCSLTSFGVRTHTCQEMACYQFINTPFIGF